MAFTLPPLGYDFAALEPTIDARTMEIHHDKHHAAYVANLNAALEGTDLAGWDNSRITQLVSDLSAVPEAKRTAVRNNGGGHWNHSFFWEIMAPGGSNAPSGDLAAAIDRDFGSFDALKDAVNKAGAARFGSGWAWLILGKDGTLAVVSTPNQDNPLMSGVAETPGTPLLGVDVWEHAYYLKYQNARPAYLAAWWNTLNWEAVAGRYAAAK